MQLDFIGDIHGHDTQLEELLARLGYVERDGCYRHPERTAVFVGDYIDRGPGIRRVLQIVKGMCDQGQAVALMGNHEYNCLCYHTPDRKGGYLRPHTEQNERQHSATMEQFAGHPEEWAMYFEWMHGLPLWYDTEQVKAVHACWHDASIAQVNALIGKCGFTEELLREAADTSTELYASIEILLKGRELPLPAGVIIVDAEGHPRDKVRIKWWMQPIDTTYGELMVHPEHVVADIFVEEGHAILDDPYSEEAAPVFFGHYWLTDAPAVYRSNVCCLDYSVARGGKLVAYRFHGETALRNQNLIW